MTGSGVVRRAPVSAADATDRPPGSSPSPRPARLLKRAEFLRVAQGSRFHARAFSLQAKAGEAPDAPARFGLTVTRKAGGSVERNRMRRRLREALRRAAPLEAKRGYDYVIVARREALAANFGELVRELERALRHVGERPDGQRRRRSKPRPSESPT